MANVYDRQVVEEGPRNAVVKLTGVLDSTDASFVPVIALSDFTNNDKNLVLTGFRFNEVEYSISDPLGVTLSWMGTNPQTIVAIAGRGEICAEEHGGLLPDTSRAGYTGDIQLSTTGFVIGKIANYTLILELVKLYRA